MADPEPGALGNPMCNPTGWMNHPVDWEQRQREFAAEAEAERHQSAWQWLTTPKNEYKRRSRYRASEQFREN